MGVELERNSSLSGKTEAEGRLTRYLLGKLSESERESIESELFADEDAFEQTLIAEDELVDAYARGELPAKERTQFEETFLNSAAARERVHFARTLAGAVSDARRRETTQTVAAQRSPGFFSVLWASATRWRIAEAAIAVVLIAALSWLLVERANMRRELQGLRAEQARLSEQSEALQHSADAERARNAAFTAQLQSDKERTTSESSLQPVTSEQVQKSPSRNRFVAVDRSKQSNVVSTGIDSDFQQFSLTAGSTRGGLGNELNLRPKVKVISLRLNLETEASYPEYRASFETAEGRIVKSVDSVKPARPNAATIDLPFIRAVDLPPGTYILSLSGKRADGTFQPVATYSFRIARK